MPLIILSQQHWKVPGKRGNWEKKKGEYHLCKEIKISVIEWLNGIIMLSLDHWRINLQTVLIRNLLKTSS